MKRIGLLLLSVTACIALTWPTQALAQTGPVEIWVWVDPAEVVPAGGTVSFDVLLNLTPLDEPMTVTEIKSDRYGDVSDSANPVLTDTTCALPATRQPGTYFGAYSWGCRYRVWVAGESGEVRDTVTVSVTRADGTKVVVSALVAVAITTANGAIHGTVTDDVTEAPLANVLLSAMGPGNGTGLTDTAGRYSLGSLPPGEYRLMASNESGPYAREWWDDADDFHSADLVTVVGGEVTTVDWALSLGGVIEGRVTDQVSGAPISAFDISWVAVLEDGSAEGPSGASVTDANGSYRIEGLYAADYHVCFDALDYRPECWDNQADVTSTVIFLGGDPIAVNVRTVVTGIDAALARSNPPTTLPPPDSSTPASLPFTGPQLAVGLMGALALVALAVGGTILYVSGSPIRNR